MYEASTLHIGITRSLNSLNCSFSPKVMEHEYCMSRGVKSVATISNYYIMLSLTTTDSNVMFPAV